MLRQSRRSREKMYVPKVMVEIRLMNSSYPRNPEMRNKKKTMETCTCVTGQKRKRKKMLNRTGPSTNAPTLGNKATGKRKRETRRMTPTKETATRATRTRDPVNCRESNSGDRNKALQQRFL
jgi:hypothetical protein